MATAKKKTKKPVSALKKSAAKRASARSGSRKTSPTRKPSTKKAQAAKGNDAPRKRSLLKSLVLRKKSSSTKRKITQSDTLDLNEIPSGLVTRYSTTLCLACIFDLFTRRLGIAPRTAYTEIKRHSPSIEELTARQPERPYFRIAGKNPHCPYCDSAKRWHARIDIARVEGGKASDAARRSLIKSLVSKNDDFTVMERKSTAQAVFFEWLDHLGRKLDFDGSDHAWMLAATKAYLERREPKVDWSETFDGVRQVRRSQRIEEGWERDGTRLFLSPSLYNDVLLVQYLVSRSHRHGGRTFEGRLTLPEFVRRLRSSGHLDAHGINDRDQFDVLEKLVEQLTGGDTSLKLHYIIDRRDLLTKVKDVYARYA